MNKWQDMNRHVVEKVWTPGWVRVDDATWDATETWPLRFSWILTSDNFLQVMFDSVRHLHGKE